MIRPVSPFFWPTIRLLPLDIEGEMTDYEFLLKLCTKMNEVISNLAAMGKNVQELQQQFEQLKKYVDDYFNGLDVKGQIEQVINDMIASGEFNQVIEETFGTMEMPGNAGAGVLNKIMECAYSYYENQDKLVYAHRYEAHNGMNYQYGPQQFTVDGKTGYAINCNSFGSLVLLGVPFSGSMYNLQNGLYNSIGQAGYRYNILGEDITNENYLQIDTTRDMGKRFREKHRLYKATTNFSNVQPGDMIFYISKDKDISGYTDITDEFDHCAICLSVGAREAVNNRIATNSVYMTVEVVNGPNPVVFKRNTIQNISNTFKADYVYIGRPSYPELAIVNRGIAYYNGLTNSRINVDVTDLDIHNNELITIDLDFQPSAAGQAIDLYFNNNYYSLESYNQTFSNAGDAGNLIHYQFVTMAQANNSNTDYSQVSVIGIKGPTSSQWGNVKIIKGFGGQVEPNYYRYFVANNMNELKTVMQGILSKYFTYKCTTMIEARIYLSIPNYPEGTYQCVICVDSTGVWVFGPEINFKFYNNSFTFYNGIADVSIEQVNSLPVGFMGKSSQALNGSTANFIIRRESGSIVIGGAYIKTISNSGTTHTWSDDAQ